MGGTALAPVRRLGDRFKGRSTGDVEGMTTPAKVRLMLQQLGPTYVKLGQMVSSRADALPTEWSSELDKLQSTVPPFSWESAKRIITTELGAEPEELFGSIEPEPFAAASLAQVHRATLKDGRAVVIKVQRPDVQSKVRADLGVIAELASVAESRSGLARQLDAGGLVKEFSNGVLEELDYTVEAYHARRLADVLESMEGVGVPTHVSGAQHRPCAHDGLRARREGHEGGAARPIGRSRDGRADLHPRDDQADPGRRLLPCRPASREHHARHEDRAS